MHRSDDAGQLLDEITEGLPTEFGFAAAAHPHDRDSFYVIPLDPGHGRCMPDGQRGGLAHARRRLELAAARSTACRSDDAHLGVLREGMAIDAYDVPGLYFGTSTGPGVRERRRGRELGRDRRATCPAIASVEVAVLA